MEKDYIVLLVFVVGHDGDDGVMYEQAKGQDPREAWERRSGKKRYIKMREKKDVDDYLYWVVENTLQGGCTAHW